MMAFILLLMVSLSVLTRVELSSSGLGIEQLRAQQAAVLALSRALGELQASAGPDQRVTARADILTGGYSGLIPSDPKSQWTGVWRTDTANPANPDQKTFVGWLASMSVDNQQLGAATGGLDHPVTLVSERTNEAGDSFPAVEAEVLENDDENFAYAWVVLDEGVKAKLNTRSWRENDAVYSGTGQLAQALRFGLPEGRGPEVLAGLGAFGEAVSPSQLTRFNTLSDLGQFFDESTASGYFHDLTANCNVKDGGLRRDLTRGLDDQFGELAGESVLDVFPLKWDSLAAWYKLYERLDDPNSTLPLLNPRDTLPVDWDGGREEFDQTKIETVSLLDGGIRDWQLTSHPIAPVVQQVIWRFGGVTADYKDGQVGEAWDWRSDRPAEGVGGRDNKEAWGYLRWGGRHVVSPLVVLWNPYNVALDASDYRITYDPAVTVQLVARSPETASASAESDVITKGPIDMVDLWQESNSTGRTGHFTVELFSTYDRAGKTESQQTVLQPGEMKVFGLRFEPSTSYVADNSYSGGFGGWSSNPVPTQLIGPVNGDAYVTFRGTVASRGFGVAHVNLDWVQDRLNLDFGNNTASTDPNDFRLTLSLADANVEGTPSEGFVVRDAWGLRPPASASGSYPFAGIWTRNSSSPTEELTLYDYYSILNNSNLMTGADNADILYAASLVARLKTGATELGTDSVPVIAHFNPLAWHTRAGHPGESHSPLWDVSVFNRSDWHLDKINNAALSGVPAWGNSASTAGQQRVVLKEIPRQPLFSVGQFMHADIGVYDTVPLYTVGNSYAPPFGAQTERIYAEDTEIDGNHTKLEAIDLSWYYNDALFDSWFFSTVPSTGQSTRFPPFEAFDLDYIRAGKSLPNSRYRYFSTTGTFDVGYESRLRDIDTAAASLLVDGAFNINSTSVAAWKSVLASLRQSEALRYYNVANGSDIAAQLEPDEMGTPLPRFIHPMASNANADSGAEPAAWAGFRSLSEDELDVLARRIVEQVRLRGPFLSLSDFVNRRLVDGPTGASGALQTALDDAGSVNRAADFGGTPDQSTIWGNAVNWEEHAPASAAGAPGWVLQSDILQMLAPILSARSDTFRIRAYGAALDPISGEPVARAWCEAIVQRVPNWVDTDEPAQDGPNLPLNQSLGRRFVLVSFQWLTPSEI
jgi:hypothetical protein